MAELEPVPDFLYLIVQYPVRILRGGSLFLAISWQDITEFLTEKQNLFKNLFPMAIIKSPGTGWRKYHTALQKKSARKKI